MKLTTHCNDNRTIHVINPSVRFIPEFTLSRKIGGTIYHVTGSYVGTALLHTKMKRILSREMEGSE